MYIISLIFGIEKNGIIMSNFKIRNFKVRLRFTF